MNNLTIGISTFKNRFESLCRLVNQIRAINKDIQILIAVNGEFEPFDEDYRTKLMRFCSDVPGTFLIMQTEFRSLSKLWNEIVVHANTEYIYLLNDDVEFLNPNVFDIINHEIETNKSHLFLAPKNSWSHFVVSKQFCERLGYFDERLLGIGAEDGCAHWRYERAFGTRPNELTIHGVYNRGDYDAVNPAMRCHVNNKAAFNEEFTYNTKFIKDDKKGIQGFFDYKVSMVDPYPEFYPAEIFFRVHKQELKK
jgi:hypothetical protein